jgi:hypothetical protein
MDLTDFMFEVDFDEDGELTLTLWCRRCPREARYPAVAVFNFTSEFWEMQAAMRDHERERHTSDLI